MTEAELLRQWGRLSGLPMDLHIASSELRDVVWLPYACTVSLRRDGIWMDAGELRLGSFDTAHAAARAAADSILASEPGARVVLLPGVRLDRRIALSLCAAELDRQHGHAWRTLLSFAEF